MNIATNKWKYTLFCEMYRYSRILWEMDENNIAWHEIKRNIVHITG